MTTEAHRQPNSLLKTLGWAVFLGCSWTWCIGMFLPVLLVRDHGAAAWVIFAIPNVLGAAAMGWVMRRTQDFPPLHVRHAVACSVFSLVTIAFHLFFAFWIIARLVPMGAVAAVVAAGGIFLMGNRRGKGSSDLAAGVVVLGISLVAVGVFCLVENPRPFGPPLMVGTLSELMAFAAVSVFGFALCPYLDRTFHLAYHEAGKVASRAVFGIGFGVIFFGMIIFTLLYARPLGKFLAAGEQLPVLALAAIGVHMIVQSGFTVAVHLRPIEKVFGPLVRASTLAAAIFFFGWLIRSRGELGAGEATYRLFMAFYGLVFPAYVWLCMIPRRGQSSRLDPRALRVFAIAVVVATPLYWMAFIERRMVWVAPGVAVLLASRLLLPRSAAAADDAAIIKEHGSE